MELTLHRVLAHQRQGATFPKLVGLGCGLDLLGVGEQGQICKKSAPEKGAVVSHHSQASSSCGRAMPLGETGGRGGGRMQRALTAALLPVWDNIITHTGATHVIPAGAGPEALILLMLSLQSLVKLL